MTNLETISLKVVSYCEIPQEITENHWLSENSPDCYVKFSLKKDPRFNLDDLEQWLADAYPELINTEFFIHIDY